MEYDVIGIRTININTVVTVYSIHGILAGRSDGDEWQGGMVGTGFDRDLTVGTGFDGGTGRYGQVLTAGRDGRGRFCRRNRTVGARFVDGTGR